MKPIKYVKHPVSKEDKAKYIADGFKVLDARYEPKTTKPAKRKKKAEAKD
jgi:hypothetical protein